MEIPELLKEIIQLGKNIYKWNLDIGNKQISTEYIKENLRIRYYKDDNYISINFNNKLEDSFEINYHLDLDITNIDTDYRNITQQRLSNLLDEYTEYLKELESQTPKQLNIWES